jgi:hypothetical protein
MFKYKLDQTVCVINGIKFEKARIFGRKFVDYAEKPTKQELENFDYVGGAYRKFRFGRSSTLVYLIQYPSGKVESKFEYEVFGSIVEGVQDLVNNSI